METKEKIHENKLRRMAKRQGYRLMKSRRRDPNAYDYGGYMLVDERTNGIMYGSYPLPFSASIEEVEDFLTGDDS